MALSFLYKLKLTNEICIYMYISQRALPNLEIASSQSPRGLKQVTRVVDGSERKALRDARGIYWRKQELTMLSDLDCLSLF